MKKIVLTTWFFCVIAAVIVYGGLRLNLSGSAPKGLWFVLPLKFENIKRGMIVSVCAPHQEIVLKLRDKTVPEGPCPGTNTEPLLKPVAAIPGDEIVLAQNKNILVNGRAIPNSQAISNITGWKTGTYKVRPGEVWLVSAYDARSFDSRYFGPVSFNNILGKAKALLVKGNVREMTEGK